VDARRAALIVASYEYQDPGLRRLRAPAQDAKALARVLSDPKIGDFDVRTLLNEPGHAVDEAVEEFFADRTPDDLLLLHFSCHGIKDESGELYFATSNTKLRLLGATAVAAEFVNRCMSRSRSRRVVLLLDCCYAGAFERGMLARADKSVAIEERFGGRGRAVITASSSMEYAFEGDELAEGQEPRPSLFTSALVEGLDTGEADRDQDGYVGLDELYDYIYDKVREGTPNQTPGKWTYGVQGDLHIARRSRPVTVPAPLPPELQQAIDHPLASIRLGSVRELERLLRSTHAGLALGAKMALQALTQDDSRTVSLAAIAALEADARSPALLEPVPPKLEVSVAMLDFGRLTSHSGPARRTVRLRNSGSGVLNTRVTAQPGWLELHLVGDELAVTVDTEVAGNHDDLIRVESDGGSATIRVRARVEDQPLAVPRPTASAGPEPVGPMPGRAESAPRLQLAGEGSATFPVPAGVSAGATAPTPPTAPRMADSGALQVQADWRVLVAGGLALVAATLLLSGLFPDYFVGTRLIDYAPARWYLPIMAALTAGAGISLLMPRTQRLIGPGLLIGTAAASFSGHLRDLINVVIPQGDVGPGLWLELVARTILVLAAGLAGLALARASNVRIIPRPPEGKLPWLIVVLGGVGAAAGLVFVGEVPFAPLFSADLTFWNVAPNVWDAAACLLVSAGAVAVAPRRFGAALLVGWIAGAAATVVFELITYYQALTYIPALFVFGSTLLALLVVVIPFSRSGPVSASATTPTPLTAPRMADSGALQVQADWRVLVAGGLALVAAALLLIGLFPDYFVGTRLLDYAPTQWPLPIMVALTTGAGISLLIPRTQRLIGPGLLIGTAAASFSGLLRDLINIVIPQGDVGPGLWLELVARTILVLAAGFAGLALARASNVRIIPRPPEGKLAWLIVVLGGVGAAACLVFVGEVPFAPLSSTNLIYPLNMVPSVWDAAAFLLVSAGAVAVAPRRFGAALLVGWVAGAAATFVFELITYSQTLTDIPALFVFGSTLLALLVVVIPLAVRDQSPRVSVDR
jgi:hypothetical protein